MTNMICDECETVAHCMKNGCVPAQQEPVAEVKAKMTGGNVGIATVIHEIYSPMRHPLVPGDLLYASPVNQSPVAHCMKNGCVPKTTKKDEAMRLALEALKELVAQTEIGLFAVKHDHVAMQDARQAINALQEALAEQPAQQEPVAIPDCGEAGHDDGACGNRECLPSFRRSTTSPPTLSLAPAPEERKRQARSADTWVHATTWRGLTYEEAKEIYTCIHGYDSSKRIAQAIEAKLKAKNSA